MLPKKRRLSSPEVRHVLSAGRGVKGGVLSLKYVQNKGDFRVSVVVPKAAAKKATKRNYARRVVYHLISSLPQNELSKLGHILGVFFVRSLPSPLAPTLRQDLITILNKIA